MELQYIKSKIHEHKLCDTFAKDPKKLETLVGNINDQKNLIYIPGRVNKAKETALGGKNFGDGTTEQDAVSSSLFGIFHG